VCWEKKKISRKSLPLHLPGRRKKKRNPWGRGGLYLTTEVYGKRRGGRGGHGVGGFFSGKSAEGTTDENRIAVRRSKSRQTAPPNRVTVDRGRSKLQGAQIFAEEDLPIPGRGGGQGGGGECFSNKNPPGKKHLMKSHNSTKKRSGDEAEGERGGELLR